MPRQPAVSSPAKYIAPVAVSYADSEGRMALVTDQSPLPVATTRPAMPEPLAGETAVSIVAGPFAPALDAPIHLQLSGTWAGTVTVQRSADAGLNRFPLTVAGSPWARFSGNANEVVWQEGEHGVTFWLDITLESGTLAYRVSQ